MSASVMELWRSCSIFSDSCACIFPFQRLLSLSPASKMPCQEVANMTDQQVRDWVNSFDTVMTDCDGVLWVGAEAIPGSPDIIQRLRQLGKRVFYVTNNSTKHRREYKTKVDKLGFGGELEEIIGTAYLAAAYLEEVGFDKSKLVYVVGSTGITQELDDVGIKYLPIGVASSLSFGSDMTLHGLDQLPISSVGAVVFGFTTQLAYTDLTLATLLLKDPEVPFLLEAPDATCRARTAGNAHIEIPFLETINDPRLTAGSLLVPEVAAVLVGFDGSFQYWNLLMAASYLANKEPDTVSEELTLETIKLSPVPLDARVGAVVVGFDINISFKKILKGASYANLPGALFVATNTDEQFPMKGTDIVVPGTGAMVAAVTTAAGRQPVVLGKPSKFMFEIVQRRHPSIQPARTLMIGDSLKETRAWEASEKEDERKLVADFYLDKLGDLLDRVKDL